MFRHDIRDLAKSSNGRKIARIVPILSIYCTNLYDGDHLSYEHFVSETVDILNFLNIILSNADSDFLKSLSARVILIDFGHVAKIFKRPKNREDSSDFDDFWTELIVMT